MSLFDLANHVFEEAIWASIAALGFAILFNVPPRMLAACAVAAAVGRATCTLLMESGLAIEPATLIAAVVIGFSGHLMARYWRAPAAIFTITGAIPLIPGTFAYRTMIALLNVPSVDIAMSSPLLAEASVNAIKTTLILGAIAVGIAFPTLLFERTKPVA